MESKELTIVIVTFKSEDKIFSCLKSISNEISHSLESGVPEGINPITQALKLLTVLTVSTNALVVPEWDIATTTSSLFNELADIN